VCRYNWHSAGFLCWPFPVLKYKCIFQINIRKQFCQTALGNCYGLKSTKMIIADLKKNKLVVSFIMIFGTLSLRIIIQSVRRRASICWNRLLPSQLLLLRQATTGCNAAPDANDDIWSVVRGLPSSRDCLEHGRPHIGENGVS